MYMDIDIDRQDHQVDIYMHFLHHHLFPPLYLILLGHLLTLTRTRLSISLSDVNIYKMDMDQKLEIVIKGEKQEVVQKKDLIHFQMGL